MFYFEVAIAKAHTDNRFFTYKSSCTIKIGDVIEVPYGQKKVWAIVVSIVKKPTFIVKEVINIPNFNLPQKSLKLMQWMFNYYPEDNGLIAQLFLPSKMAFSKNNKKAKTLTGNNHDLPIGTKEQKLALSKIKKTLTQRVLLHGDTGTGKTRVFIELTKDALSQGQSVLILVPEIGLTPQLLDDLQKYLNSPILLTHSELTDLNRSLVWQYALTNDTPSVFIGPRSALFLPFSNLGLIVIDEAHDNSYKQMQSPKYQTLNVAGKLAALHNCLLLQSTATPNVTDYEISLAHGFSIIRMLKRAAGKYKNETFIVDLTNQDNFSINPHISNDLIKATKEALSNNQQILIFLNRRGSARLVQCNSCGWQAFCPDCQIPLVYHHDSHLVRCHTCGYKKSAPNSCPKCSSIDIIYKVIGTKSLAQNILKLFPKAKIMRFDADSSASEKFYRNIKQIKNGEVDIIIGTQLITKGIDLPNLSVVGIINADTGLNLPDYRAEETTFQQLYQVTGRVVRGHIKSKAFIQTRLPEHPVMLAVKKRSWEDFYNYELSKRKQFKYPPEVFMAIIKVTKKSSSLAQTKSQLLFNQLSQNPSLTLLGPSPSFFEKTPKGYVWQIIIKSTKRSNILDAINNLPPGWSIDIDPSNVL